MLVHRLRHYPRAIIAPQLIQQPAHWKPREDHARIATHLENQVMLTNTKTRFHANYFALDAKRKSAVL
ncbi:hypothetical protein AC579_6018 [Pseudocercospora musae]|uniref:Uncharacterized protein n=1 Tax=Pseudocercospora musae TaxID=113226 RepID=A0A139HRQ2_9PEZI|nr:hypothetical protein AC579_6018 [Pseudocercospora musae]